MFRTVIGMGACVLLACSAAPAGAQSSSAIFPSQLITTPNPTAEQRTQIQQLADENMALLESGDPAQMRQAREDLRAALRDPQASTAFRHIVAERVNAQLAKLAGADDEGSAVTALQVAGLIATDESVDLLDQMLGDERETMRYVAGFGYDAALATLRGGGAALTDRRVRTMIDRLGQRVAQEPEAVVLDMNVRALISAMQIGSDTGNAALRDHALQTIVKSCSARVQKLAPEQQEHLGPMLKAAQAVRTLLQGLNINPPLPREAVVEAGGFCGDMIAFVFRSVRAGALPTAEQVGQDEAAAKRAASVTALALAQSTIPLAKDKLHAGNPNGMVPQNLDNMIRQATREADEQFLQAALDVIGDGGILTKDGFGLNANRFLK